MQKLTVAQIEAMTDAEVYALTIPHPKVQGERAFVFSLKNFESREGMAACMAMLTVRLRQIREIK